ncbi:hypothetical protein C8Q79DRAFT_919148, partial [Trametes meyenii]
RNVRLRDYETQKVLKRFSYDLKLVDGKVLPAAHALRCEGPNGCPLREPLSPTFREVVRNFRGTNGLAYAVKEGATSLPDTLQILHEHSDYHSPIQCTKPMTLDELNAECTKWINAHGRTLD